MTKNDARKALLHDLHSPKEIRTNDGMRFRVNSVEQWAINGDQLLIVAGGPLGWDHVSIRNVASIGPLSKRKRA